MRSKTGIVTSNKGNKTIVVKVDGYKTHPKYKKRYRVSSKFHAHDEENQYQEGQEVTIYETRPLSKLKRWTTQRDSAAEERASQAKTKSKTQE